MERRVLHWHSDKGLTYRECAVLIRWLGGQSIPIFNLIEKSLPFWWGTQSKENLLFGNGNISIPSSILIKWWVTLGVEEILNLSIRYSQWEPVNLYCSRSDLKCPSSNTPKNEGSAMQTSKGLDVVISSSSMHRLCYDGHRQHHSLIWMLLPAML